MKAKELMIGDYVYIKSSDGEDTHIVKVKTIEENGINQFNGFIEFSELEPIPLTEEMIKKNGFKNDVIAQKSIIAEGASNFSVILISEDNRITINNIDEYLNSFNKWSVHIDTEDMRTLCTAEITYVHELQHLLKLCKIEKEIVL